MLSLLFLNYWRKQLINEHSFPPHCVNPLTVAEGKKLRLVIDLREVNKYLVKPKFRYEDLRSLSEVFEQGILVLHVGPEIGLPSCGYFSSSSAIFGLCVGF